MLLIGGWERFEFKDTEHQIGRNIASIGEFYTTMWTPENGFWLFKIFSTFLI